MDYIILIAIGIIGFILGKKLARFRTFKKNTNGGFSHLPKAELENIQDKAQDALDERTEERKEKILEFLNRELAHQKALANCSIEDRKEGITREDVEKLLDVSDSTALKYLNELEAENKILQVGSTGHGVYYTLPS